MHCRQWLHSTFCKNHCQAPKNHLLYSVAGSTTNSLHWFFYKLFLYCFFISNINLSCWSYPLLMHSHNKVVCFSHSGVLTFLINYFSSIFWQNQMQVHFLSASPRAFWKRCKINHIYHVCSCGYIVTQMLMFMWIHVFLYLYMHTQICHRHGDRCIKLFI